jgi:hypothetical protein
LPTVGYDFSDAGDFADFVTLEPGQYVFKFTNADASQKSTAGNKKVIVDLIVVKAGVKKNAWGEGGLVRQHWNTTGGASGRFRSFLEALGATTKTKGSLKLEKYYEEEIGATVTKVPGQKLDADGNVVYFNDLRGLMPGAQMRSIIGAAEDEDEDEYEDDEDVEEEEVEEDEEEEEDEEDDEEAEDDEDEEEEEDEDEEEDDEGDEEEEEFLTPEDIKTMKMPEAKELAKEYGISTRPPKGKTLTIALLRKRLIDGIDWEGAEEEEDEEDPF